MVIMIVEVNVKAGMEQKFLEVIKHDAEHSEADEPGCLRFDVLQDMERAKTLVDLLHAKQVSCRCCSVRGNRHRNWTVVQYAVEAR